MIIGIASDHLGFKLKEEAISYLQMWGFSVVDYGPADSQVCDYPIFASHVGKAVASQKVNLGVLIGGTGIGMSIAANKIKGVRAARCVTWRDAMMSVEQDNANVLCIGEDVDVSTVLEGWLNADFDVEKFGKQFDQITKIENES